MHYLIFAETQLGLQQMPTLLVAMLLIALFTGFIIHRIYEYSLKQKEKPKKPERFRLEIIQMSEDYVRAGICLPAQMDGATMGAIMQTGILLLAKQDPLAVQILLLQILQVLGADDDITELLGKDIAFRSS